MKSKFKFDLVFGIIIITLLIIILVALFRNALLDGDRIIQATKALKQQEITEKNLSDNIDYIKLYIDKKYEQKGE